MRDLIPSNPTPVFLFSMPRSGSTLVQSLLDGHPQLLMDVGDSRFFRSFYPLAKGKSPDAQREIADQRLLSYHFDETSPYYQRFLSHINIPEFKATFTRLLAASRQQEKDYLEAYIFALGLAAGTFTEQTRHWSIKSLSEEYAIHLIRHWWPEAKFIHIVRDPRDVYTSHKRRDIKNNRRVTPIDGFAYLWARSVTAYLQNTRHLPHGHAMLLRYEDVIKDLEGSLHTLSSFMGIDYEDTLLHPTKGHGRVRWGGNAATGDKVYNVHQQATEKWKAGLSTREVLHLESILHHEMTATQYVLSQEPQALMALPLVRFKNRLRRLKYSLRHWAA